LKIYQEDGRRAQDGLLDLDGSDVDDKGVEDGMNRTVSLEELRAEKSILEKKRD